MILLRNVSKYYASTGQWALRDIDMEIGAGTFVIITGPSGSGKTSLLNLMSGLDRPTTGEVVFGERSLSNLSDAQLSAFRNRDVGFIFQTFYLNPRWDLVSNVALPLMIAGVARRERHRRAAAILARLGLAAFGSQSAGTLSAGQKQRAVIARAIVNGPKTILADEPVANLDTELAGEVLSILRGQADSGVTVIAVQHQLRDTSFADRTIQIMEGRLEE